MESKQKLIYTGNVQIKLENNEYLTVNLGKIELWENESENPYAPDIKGESQDGLIVSLWKTEESTTKKIVPTPKPTNGVKETPQTIVKNSRILVWKPSPRQLKNGLHEKISIIDYVEPSDYCKLCTEECTTQKQTECRIAWQDQAQIKGITA